MRLLASLAILLLAAGCGPEFDALGEAASCPTEDGCGSPVALGVVTTSLAEGQVGARYEAPLQAVGGSPPYAWSVTAGVLPTGLSLDGGGVLSGTPSSVANTQITVELRDANLASIRATYSLRVLAAMPLAITTPAQLPNGVVGSAYSTSLAAVGGTAPYRWQVTSGSLPASFSLDQATGVISGAPTSAVTASFTITVTDSNAMAVSLGTSLRIFPAGLTITSPQLPNGVVSNAYIVALAAAGGTAPYRWQMTSGSLPTGLSLDQASGVISGMPTSAVTASMTIAVTDANAVASSAVLSIRVFPAPILITTSPQFPVGVIGVGYGVTLAAAGGTAPYLWRVTSGSLPPGLSLNQSTGVISGMPTSAVAANVTISVTDVNASTAGVGFSLQISAAPLAITAPPQLPGGTVGTAYSVSLAAAGGTTPYRWQVNSGSLPAGLSLNQTSGVISGTPTSAVTASVTISVTDVNALTASAGFSLKISAAPPTITTPPQLPNGAVGTAYSVTLAATGGTTPYRWQVSSGSLPTGLSLSQTTGVISGTPTGVVATSFTITVTDASNSSASQGASLQVLAAPLSITTSPQLPGGTVGTAYSVTLAATGGTTPYRWQVNSGSLPAGLSLNQATGAISGTPTSAVTANVTIGVTDVNALTASKAFSLLIPPPPPIVTTSPQLPGGTVGAPYSVTLAATGGTAPYRWQVSAGTLPAGLSLNQATGVISGTPTSTATANPTIVVTDANALTASRAFSLQVSPAALAITTPSQLRNGTVGAAYSVTLAATGGTTPYRWQVSVGSLPAGLGLNQTTGVISGTPTNAVTGNPTIVVTDANALTATAAFSLQISSVPLAITTPLQLPAATAGASYSVTLAASGGTAPYTWQVTSGSLLPAGLVLDPGTGVISGTPANAATASIPITVTDANAAGTSATFGLTINASGTAPPGWQLTWSDEFNGSGAVDPAKWSFEIGMVRNQEAQYYSNRLENARQENGMLVIEARKDGYNGAAYSSASIHTRGKREFRYGRIDVRAQLAGGRGAWPAIWMQGVSGSWPQRGEIDIMENVGYDQNTIFNTVHMGSGYSMGSSQVSDPHQGFHVYSLEWYADRMDFLVDGIKTFTYFNDGTGDSNTWPFAGPEYLMLNLAVGGNWGGQQGIDDSIFPAKYYIDYVRYYTQQ